MMKTFLDGVQLPVNPFDDITISTQGNNQQIEIIAVGDITKIGSRKLSAINISSLFTANSYPFSTLASPRETEYYVGLITGRMEKRRPVRLVLAGESVDINLRCNIEDFKQTRAAGETNECYYTLSLREYREPVVRYIDFIPDELLRPRAQVLDVRAEEPPAVRTHTAKWGDTLWGMAKTYYGDGAQYMKIYNANKSLNPSPNDIYVGQVFVIP